MFNISRSHPEVIFALSQKTDGNMLLIEENGNGQENRDNFLKPYGLLANSLIRAGLVHRNFVRIVGREHQGTIIDSTDGLITDIKNVGLSITVADCLPLYFYEPKRGVVGLAHAGWRGIHGNIADVMVEKIKNRYQSDIANLLVGIGPGIGNCHFEVKPDVAEAFKNYKDGFSGYLDYISRKVDGSVFIDLKGIVKKQLLDAGVKLKNIEVNPDCTYCLSHKYFSRRRDQPTKEAMLAVIGLR